MALKKPALNTLLSNAQAALAEINTKQAVWVQAVNTRITQFEQLSPLATRIIATLQSSGVDAQLVRDARVWQRKLQGRRAKAQAAPADPNAPAPITHSVSQRSFDMRLQHFSGLIALLQSEPAYTPNEADLKVPALLALLANLQALNIAAMQALNTLNNARLSRNHMLYDASTGLVTIAGDVKQYCIAVYGAKAPEAKAIKSIAFRKREK